MTGLRLSTGSESAPKIRWWNRGICPTFSPLSSFLHLSNAWDTLAAKRPEASRSATTGSRLFTPDVHFSAPVTKSFSSSKVLAAQIQQHPSIYPSLCCPYKIGALGSNSLNFSTSRINVMLSISLNFSNKFSIPTWGFSLGMCARVCVVCTHTCVLCARTRVCVVCTHTCVLCAHVCVVLCARVTTHFSAYRQTVQKQLRACWLNRFICLFLFLSG